MAESPLWDAFDSSSKKGAESDLWAEFDKANPPPGLTDRVKQGFRSTVAAGKIALTDDPEKIAGVISENEKTRLPQSQAALAMQEEIKPYAKAAEEANGPDAVGKWAILAAKRFQQFVSNPREFAGMIAENLSNSAPGMAGMVVGGVGGSYVAGPVGGVVGSIAGGTAGGYAIEQGSAMIEQVTKGAQAAGININDTQALAQYIAANYPDLLEKSRLKGIGTAGTDAILNRLTLGLAGLGERAIVRDAKSISAGMKAGTVTANEGAASVAELQAKEAASKTLGAKVARGTGVVTAEMGGEMASEAAGQALAYGKVDPLEVIDEGLVGIGQGAVMAAGRGTFNRVTGSSGDSVSDAIAKTATDVAAFRAQEQRAARDAAVVGNIAAAPDVETAIAEAAKGVAELPEITGGPVTQEQQLWVNKRIAQEKVIADRQAQLEAEINARREADYSKIVAESRLPAAEFDVARDQQTGAAAVAEAPSAMQLAFQKAQERLQARRGGLGDNALPNESLADAGGGNAVPSGQFGNGGSSTKGGDSVVNGPSVRAESEISSIDTTQGKNLVNGAPRNTQAISDSGEAPSLRAELQRLAQGPLARTTMNSSMPGLSRDQQIFRGIVQSIPVDVMNNIPVSQRTPYNLFGNDAVLKALTANAINNNANQAVAGGSEASNVPATGKSSHTSETQSQSVSSSNSTPSGPLTPTPVVTPPPTTQPADTVEEKPVVKITGRDVTTIELPKLRKFAQKGGPDVRQRAIAEIERRIEEARIRSERRQSFKDMKDTPSRDLLNVVMKNGGVNKDYALDVAGDKGVRGLGGMGARIFRAQKRGPSGVIQEGHGLDETAVALWEAGYMTREELDENGSQIASDLLRQAIDGTLGPITESQIQKAAQRGERDRQDREDAEAAMRAETAEVTPDNTEAVMSVADALGLLSQDEINGLDDRFRHLTDPDEFAAALINYAKDKQNADNDTTEETAGGSQEAAGEAPRAEERRAEGENRVEKRQDDAQRKRVADMTPEEKDRALLTDRLTGLHNDRWLDENIDAHSHIVAFDADSLKWVNDNLGHEQGDKLLEAWGEAIKSATALGARVGGDEFFALADSKMQAEVIAAKVKGALNRATITAETPGGEITIQGIGVSFGIGTDRKTADEKLNQHKQAREASGERAGRGQEPPGVTRKPTQRQQDQVDQDQRQDDQVAPLELTAQSPEEVKSESDAAQAKADKQPAEGEVTPTVPALRQQLYVIGPDGRRFPVDDFEDASKKWEAFRDQTGEGVSVIGSRTLIVDQDGKEVARISYNGRVWPPGDYKPGAKSLYDPADQREPALELESQTTAEAKAAADEKQAAADDKAAADRKAEEEARAEREKKEIAQRSQAAADDFSLTPTAAVDKATQKKADTQEAERQLSGSRDMFAQPAPNPMVAAANAMIDAANAIKAAVEPKTDEQAAPKPRPMVYRMDDGSSSPVDSFETAQEIALENRKGGTVTQGEKALARISSDGQMTPLQDTDVIDGESLRVAEDVAMLDKPAAPKVEVQPEAQTTLSEADAGLVQTLSEVYDAKGNDGYYALSGDGNRDRRKLVMMQMLGRPAKSSELTLKALTAATVKRLGGNPENMANVEQEQFIRDWYLEKRLIQLGDAPTTYLAGDKGVYTGKKSMNYGGEFYELLMLEGGSKGRIRVTKQAPSAAQPKKTLKQLTDEAFAGAAPLSDADKLRKEADALTKQAMKMMEGIEPGQPVRSTADRNKRDKALEIQRNAADLERQADALDAASRNSFTVERLNRDTDEMESFTFERGEYVEAHVNDKVLAEGEIDGISNAKKQASIDGLWYDFGQIYKGERPAEVASETVPLSEAIEASNEKTGVDLTDADRIATVKDHKAFVERLYEGNVSVEEFQAEFERVTKGKGALQTELAKLTKAELLKKASGFNRPSDTKEHLIKAAYRTMVDDFILTGSFSYNPMAKGGFETAVRERVESTTAADIAAFVERVKAQEAERMSRLEGLKGAIENPQTLSDFETFFRVKKVADLTPEQLERYDNLVAERDREARDKKMAERAKITAAGESVGANIIETKHTKKGHDLFVVQLEKRVERDDYNRLNSAAKRMGGYYSSFRGGGAVVGFQFTTRENAEAFSALAGGDTTAATEAAKARQETRAEEKEGNAVERLTDMADRIEEKANESLNADRKANTARRARMANAAEAEARNELALAKTMRNIAQAIKDGTAKNIDLIRTKAQVVMMTGMLRRAHSEMARDQSKDGGTNANEQKRQKLESQPYGNEDMPYVKYPAYEAWRSDIARMGRELSEIEGAKQLGERLLKVADDAKPYAKAVQKDAALLSKVALRTQDGGMATFRYKTEAESAWKRSPARSRSMVIEVSNPGKTSSKTYAVVVNPQIAKEKGYWKGADDERMRLSPEIAEIALAKAQAHNSRAKFGDKVTYPYFFDTVKEERTRLSSMGIESTPVLRAAMREFINAKADEPKADKVKQLERALAGKANIGIDYFPTPAGVAQDLVSKADIQEGMAVLEPSAGNGNIADAIRAAGVDPDVAEMSGTLREILEAKGYNTVANDFMDMNPRGFTYGDVFQHKDGRRGVMRGSGGIGSGRVGFIPEGKDERTKEWVDRDDLEGVEKRGSNSGYDRIVMNPPFSKGMDIDHVRHAFELLRPGGRIVAIMGEGAFTRSDKKATEFQEWLNEVGGTEEKLPAGTFLDPSLPSTTGANARMVVIDKPESEQSADAKFSRTTTATKGISVTDAQATHDRIARNFSNMAPVTILNNPSELPAKSKDLRDQIKKSGATNDVEAAYYDGEIFVFADNLASEERLETVLFEHEVTHYGLRGVFGKDLNPMLNGLMARNPELRRKATAERQRLGLDSNVAAVEEVLADMPDSELMQLKGIDKFISSIRDWLAKHGFMKLADRMDKLLVNRVGEQAVADALVGDIVRAARDFARNGKPERTQMFMGGTRFAGEATTTDRADQTQTPAFKAWFGDSILVKNGKPERLYHGTADDITQFDLNHPNRKDTGWLGTGVYLTDRAELAGSYSLIKGGSADSNVMPMFARLENPYYATSRDKERLMLISHSKGKDAGRQAADQWTRELQAKGHDGVILEYKADEVGKANESREIVVFDPAAVKSAIGNRGTFDAGNPDIRFSRSIPQQIMDKAPRVAQDVFRSDRKLNRVMSKVNTPFHISEIQPQFKPVYDEAQDFMHDVSRIALGSADKAIDLLPRVESWRDVLPKAAGGKGLKAASDQDIAAIHRALYAGTFYGGGNPMNGIVWTDDELKGKETFKRPIPAQLKNNPLNDAQIKLYRQGLAAVADSLEEHSKALVWRIGRNVGVELDNGMTLADMSETAREQADDQITDKSVELEYLTDEDRINAEAEQIAADAEGDPRDPRGSKAAARYRAEQKKAAEKVQKEIDELESFKAAVDDIDTKTTTLIEKGYFPAMRFGEYFVDVYEKDEGGKVDRKYFARIESQADQNRIIREMRAKYPDATIDHGIMNTSAHKLMAGMSLDTMEMFVDHIKTAMGDSADLDPLMQEFLRMATTERSTLAREIHRKGVPGQSEDITRVLAQFITGNARNAASTYHTADMLKSVREIDDGDVARYATDYVRYLQDPAEGASKLRGFIANYYLMGSVAFGAVNMTQPALVTMPKLSEYVGAAKATAYVVTAAKSVVRGKATLPKGEREAFERAEKDGVVSPQEIHQLRAESGTSLTEGPLWRATQRAAKAIGVSLPSGLTARKALFAWGSIYSLTEQFNRGTSFLAAYRLAIDEKMDDPYAFASKMVDETQFTYSKANRPEVMRGPVGAVVLQFKQFTISYIELAARLYKTDKAAFGVMMLMLFAMAGMEGLPFSEDIEDAIDSIGQKLGYATNSKKTMRKLATELAGPMMADILLHGVSAVPGFPLDVSSRVGMHNIIPGSSLFKTSEPDKTREIMNALGPTAGIADRLVLKGDMAALLPKAIQDLVKSKDMAVHDMYRDAKGKKVIETDLADAFFKGVGFMPASVARANRIEYQEKQDIDLVKTVESGIAGKWAEGIFEKNQDKVSAAREKLKQWNEDNPQLPIRINMGQIVSRVREMNKTREQRFVKAAPPEIRGTISREMREAR